MNKSKRSLILSVLLFVLALVLFISGSENKAGTPIEVLNANVGSEYDSVKQVLEIIEVNDEGDALCAFETDEKIAVAYLNCVGEGEYKYGLAVEFDQFWDTGERYDISNLKAGDSELLIKFVVTDDSVDVKESTKKYNFSVGGKNPAFHLISIEEEKCFGYEYYIEPNQS